ncbi:MAG: sulfur carrier protein ThiS adenylyltransferase ThiF [Victivallales bacterium]|nr:sulfur carrier protein ThiS adenylyltransferase ThiF [Victivallales bacterium]
MLNDIFKSNPPGLTELMRHRHFMVFGAGGLGSNAAVILARAGAGRLTLVDFDVVEPSNLNRQYYFLDQVGMAKVDALRDNLLRVNPEIVVEAICERVDSENVRFICATGADVILECFDTAESKTLLVSHCLRHLQTTPVVAVSGLAGITPIENMRVNRGPGRLIVIGDGESEMTPETGTVSSRVTAAAAMQAHEAIRLII